MVHQVYHCKKLAITQSAERFESVNHFYIVEFTCGLVDVPLCSASLIHIAGHSGLVMRLSRARRNDPMLRADPSMEDVRRRIAGHDVPSLEQPELVDLPQYSDRRKMNARDPHAVVAAFRVCTHVVLPRALGYLARLHPSYYPAASTGPASP